MNEAQKFCGFVAVIGTTNAGKSTLINRLVGHKVSIVSRKVQTTRSRILGLIQQPSHQIILIDTPGIFRAKTRLEHAMVSVAWRSIPDADYVIHIVDCQLGLNDAEKKICAFLQQQKTPTLLVLNKIDLIEKKHLLKVIAAFQQEMTYQETCLISATKGDGVEHLLSLLKSAMPEGSFLFDEEQISDLPERLLAAEIVREHLFDRLHQELPYALSVVPEQWQEHADGSVLISLCILVQRAGHKGIVIGHKGETLKAIGQAARKDLSQTLKRQVHVRLYVKVRRHWQDDRALYQLWGLDFNAR